MLVSQLSMAELSLPFKYILANACSRILMSGERRFCYMADSLSNLW